MRAHRIACGRWVASLALLLSLCTLLLVPAARAQSAGSAPAAGAAGGAPLKIGIIGTGRIGGALARYWAMAGNEVFVSSRHPEELKSLVAQLGPHAHAGTPSEAAAFGQVILVSVPYAAMPQLGQDLASQLAGKIILDTSNPVERRDGAMARSALQLGAGVATARFLHDSRVVRAFNCIPAAVLASQSNRQPERIAIPIGGDDPRALRVAERLVREAGFDPVVVGSLASTRQFDLGGPLASGQLTALQLRGRIAQLGH